MLALLLLAVHPWLPEPVPAGASLGERIAPPAGFAREPAAPGTFAAFLRGLPLLAGTPEVRLFDGRLKGNQGAHAAVVDIDVGGRDLQQCADAVIRLRAEYLFGAGRPPSEIAFRVTSGDTWTFASAPAPRGHPQLRRWLDRVFGYAGSASLERQLRRVPLAELAAGDVFIRGGFPGHAVIVADTARDPRTGRRAFLLVQSYMPAQQMHVLLNPARSDPWYLVDEAEPLVTPEWTFGTGALRRFP